jgi:hypothetical protein
MTLNGAPAAHPSREMDRAVAVPAEVTAAAGPVSTREAQATAGLVTGTGRAKGAHPRPVVVRVSPEVDLALLAPAARGPAWAPARDRAPALQEAPGHGRALVPDRELPGLARCRAAVPTRPTVRLPIHRLTGRVPAAPQAAPVDAAASDALAASVAAQVVAAGPAAIGVRAAGNGAEKSSRPRPRRRTSRRWRPCPRARSSWSAALQLRIWPPGSTAVPLTSCAFY